jgi:hypothetical protein
MQVIANEVLIFKSSTDESDHVRDDPYVSTLQQSQYTVKSIPVLDFNFMQLSVLLDSLLSPEKYSGKI